MEVCHPVADLTHEDLWAVCRTLAADYEPWGDVGDEERGADCSCGCRWFHALEGVRGMDWGVCGSPRSVRRGLLTFEHQAGKDCFEPDPRDQDDEPVK